MSVKHRSEIFLTKICDVESVRFNGSKRKSKAALFQCKCGNQIILRTRNIERKLMQSCGCINEKFSKHRLYNVWRGMIRRCDNPKDIHYAYYGGRGVIVCDRWRDFNNFIEDMDSTFLHGLTIDRIDCNGNYEKSNCKWATRKEQAMNRRSNHVLNYNGKSLTVTQWAELLGISRSSIFSRLSRTSDISSILREELID